MNRRRSLAVLGGLAASCALSGLPARAQEAVRVRLGTLVPKGSSYHRAMQEMAERWKKAQGAGAAFTVFTDGTQGGEIDMVRRMRVGQLNAALISVVGLAEIDRSVTALQYMPMLFRDWMEYFCRDVIPIPIRHFTVKIRIQCLEQLFLKRTRQI
jgi:TRAP-type C4-dicarboxylate transport system substrate-binding protein